MSEKCLGIPFDIHCGGVDLTFPHHENEIAQSCSAHKKILNQKILVNTGFIMVLLRSMEKNVKIYWEYNFSK